MNRWAQLAVGLLLALPIAVYAGVVLQGADPGDPTRLEPVILPADDRPDGRDDKAKRGRDRDRDDRHEADTDPDDTGDDSGDDSGDVRVVTPRPTNVDDDDDGDDDREGGDDGNDDD